MLLEAMTKQELDKLSKTEMVEIYLTAIEKVKHELEEYLKCVESVHQIKLILDESIKFLNTNADQSETRWALEDLQKFILMKKGPKGE